jgi:DNA-binding PadR family transcriptional regulator
MKKENRSRFAILGMVSLRPMTGYEVQQTIERGIGNFWHESWGQIYPTLSALAADGLVKASANPGGRRGSKRYAITPAGRKALRAWLARPIKLQVGRNDLLLKLFLGVESGPDNVRAHLAQFRRAHEELREHYAAIGPWLREEHGASPHLPFWLLALRYGELETEALLAWCDEAETKLQTRRKKGKRS